MKLSYCGLDCEKCEAYIATKNNDDSLKVKVAEKWSRFNCVTIKPEDINCEGCKEDGKKTNFCQNMCKIRKCAIKHDFLHCGKCPNLSECNDIKMITDNNAKALFNLKNN